MSRILVIKNRIIIIFFHHMFKLFRRPIVIGKLYTISDLNTPKNALSAIDTKSKIPILVIDDEGFTYKEQLRDENYNLTCLSRIDDLNAVTAYPIVICDIRGVGTNFDKEKEGAFVVRELKKKFPFKQYAVYSCSNYPLESFEDDLKGIERIKKDPDIEMWRTYFDEFIRRVTDPKENWKTIRDYLIKKDVPIKEIALLESNYVDILNNRPDDMKNFPEKKTFPNLGQDVRAIIQNMIAGGLLHILGI